MLIGSESNIGDDSTIEDSVIGRGCSIGSRVHLKNCYVLDGAHIADDVIMEGSIIAQGCFVEQNTTLENGCILAPEVSDSFMLLSTCTLSACPCPCTCVCVCVTTPLATLVCIGACGTQCHHSQWHSTSSLLYSRKRSFGSIQSLLGHTRKLPLTLSF